MMGDLVNATNELQKCLGRWKQNATDPTYYEESKSTDANKLKILKEWCSKGADLDYLERERGFACVTHVFWSKTLIQFFVDKGFSVNSRDENGDTALHLAIRHSNMITTKTVYADGIFGPHMQTQICYPKNNLVQIGKFVLEHSLDSSVTNLHGETANFTLAECELRNPKNNCNKNVAKVLLAKKGAVVKIHKSDGQIVSKRQGVIDRFIDAFDGGIEFRTPSWDYSQTLLMLAASVDRLDYCERLVERGADINAVDLQGYTALHYAVLNDFHDCAEFLVNKGADTNVKSASGKDIYDLSIYHNYDGLFIHGLTPEKLVEKYEIAGAVKILKCRSVLQAVELWSKALDVCKSFNLQPSPELMDNYKFLKDNRNYPSQLYNYIWHDPIPNSRNNEMFLLAMNTVGRLSEGTTKFWKLLSLLSDVKDKFGYFNTLSKELEEIEDLASFDVADFKSLNFLVRLMDNKLNGLDHYWESRKIEVTSDIISQYHSFAHLIIACFDKLILLTDSNKVSDDCMDTYVKLAILLTSLRARANVISDAQSKDNEKLLTKLVQLDVRNKNGDSLMHRILENEYHPYKKFDSDVLGALIDFKFVNVKTKNARGLEPVQLINWKNWNSNPLPLKVLVKLAERKADIDVRTRWDGETIRDVFQKEDKYLAFQYDNLQCGCARVLARSLERYSDRVPKHMVQFIRMHMQ